MEQATSAKLFKYDSAGYDSEASPSPIPLLLHVEAEPWMVQAVKLLPDGRDRQLGGHYADLGNRLKTPQKKVP